MGSIKSLIDHRTMIIAVKSEFLSRNNHLAAAELDKDINAVDALILEAIKQPSATLGVDAEG